MDVAGQQEGAAPRTLPNLIDSAVDNIPASALSPLSKSAGSRQARPPRPYVAPRSALEQQVAELWKEILKVEPISIDDRFLELGGDSILAGRIAARLCAHYSIELPMPVLFATPTIAGVAEVIELKTAERPDNAELEACLSAIEDLTDEEAERLLADESN